MEKVRKEVEARFTKSNKGKDALDVKPGVWKFIHFIRREDGLMRKRWLDSVAGLRQGLKDGPLEGGTRRILQHQKEDRLLNVILKFGSIPNSDYLDLVSHLSKD